MPLLNWQSGQVRKVIHAIAMHPLAAENRQLMLMSMALRIKHLLSKTPASMSGW